MEVLTGNVDVLQLCDGHYSGQFLVVVVGASSISCFLCSRTDILR